MLFRYVYGNRMWFWRLWVLLFLPAFVYYTFILCFTFCRHPFADGWKISRASQQFTHVHIERVSGIFCCCCCFCCLDRQQFTINHHWICVLFIQVRICIYLQYIYTGLAMLHSSSAIAINPFGCASNSTYNISFLYFNLVVINHTIFMHISSRECREFQFIRHFW